MNAQHKIIEILLILSHNNSKYHRICGCGLLLLLWYSSHLAEKLSKYLKCGIMWVCDRVSVWVSLPNPKPKEKRTQTQHFSFYLQYVFCNVWTLSCFIFCSFSHLTQIPKNTPLHNNPEYSVHSFWMDTFRKDESEREKEMEKNLLLKMDKQ